MEKYLIDTSVLINHIRGVSSHATAFLQNNLNLAISAVTLGELLQGVRNQRELAAVMTSTGGFDIEWGNDTCNRSAIDLLTRHRLALGLQLFDALQAAIALTQGYTLVTDNLKHFARIPGLKVIAPPA